MSALVPCPGCGRHVRVAETRCPFCSVAVGGLSAPTVASVAAGTLTRALIFSGFAAIGMGLGCGDDAPVAQPYGAPPDDGSGGEQRPPPDGEEATPPPDAPPGEPSAPDAGTADPGTPTAPDPGQPMLMYGVPPSPN